MEALTSPSSCTVSSSASSITTSVREKRTGFVNRLDSCFWRTRMTSNIGLLSTLIAQQSNHVSPSFSLSPKTQVELVELNVQQLEEKHRSEAETKMVHVKFHLEKECLFGQQFLMVGDDPMLGSWDPELAVPLTWSDRHVWFAELEIPLGKSIQYKFILKESTEAILWQPGPDRVFQAWETQNTIIVSDDWENAELQVISVEEGKSKEKPKTRVVKSKPRMAKAKRASSTSEKVMEINGSVSAIGLVSFEEEAVLVPGLSPLREILTEEDDHNQVGEKISVGDSVEALEAKDRSLVEKYDLDILLREVTSSSKSSSLLTDYLHLEYHEFQNQCSKEMLFEQLIDKPTKQQAQELDFREGKNGDKSITENVDLQLRRESKKTPNFAETEANCEAETKDENDIFFNDLRWGQKTLHNFLTNFGLF